MGILYKLLMELFKIVMLTINQFHGSQINEVKFYNGNNNFKHYESMLSITHSQF